MREISMEKRFSHIKDPKKFLKQLEHINDQMIKHGTSQDEKPKSLVGRLRDTFSKATTKSESQLQDDWMKLTGYMYPILTDKNGNPTYLDSFLKENHLQSSIRTDFYHLPEQYINAAYTNYEADRTRNGDWMIYCDAEKKLTSLIPEHGDLWTHISHSGAKSIAEQGVMLNTHEDNGKVNLGRNLSHYEDIGHVMAAINVGAGYKGADTIFLYNIPDENEVKLTQSECSNDGHVTKICVAPEQICAVLTVENGKIMDAESREEFLEKFQEHGISSPQKTELELELEELDRQAPERENDIVSRDMTQPDLEL